MGAHSLTQSPTHLMNSLTHSLLCTECVWTNCLCLCVVLLNVHVSPGPLASCCLFLCVVLLHMGHTCCRDKVACRWRDACQTCLETAAQKGHMCVACHWRDACQKCLETAAQGTHVCRTSLVRLHVKNAWLPLSPLSPLSLSPLARLGLLTLTMLASSLAPT